MAQGSNKTPSADILWPFERLARMARAAEFMGELNPAQWEALRYLARANRFSNSPMSLAHYLGATKGTISQTLKALERKGYVIKTARLDEKRSIALTLTDKARDKLKADPLASLEQALADVPDKTRRRLAKGLQQFLTRAVQQAGQRSFGTCHSCRYFRERGHEDHAAGPHLCMWFKAPLSHSETDFICHAHEERK